MFLHDLRTVGLNTTYFFKELREAAGSNDLHEAQRFLTFVPAALAMARANQ